MIDFIEYVVSELKNRRLTKQDALNLIRQFSGQPGARAAGSAGHPLLQRNVSDLAQLCHASTFSGEEFFLRDHQVAAEGGAVSVLPGVAFLEMARAAVVNAWPGMTASSAVALSDVVWVKPIAVAQRREVFIALASAEEGGGAAIEFEIFTREEAADGTTDEVVHCRGLARRLDAPARERLDLPSIRRRMARGAVDADGVYAAYGRMGMRFGPAHRAVEQVWQGTGETLAALRLPAAVSDSLDSFVLHPSLMDGALQSALGLLDDPQAVPDRPSLPFALESLRVLSACTPEMQAWIRQAPGSRPGDAVSRLDIDLCDVQGQVCVQLRGFSSRTLGPASAPATGLVMARPAWRAQALDPLAARHDGPRVVLAAGLPQLDAPALPLPGEGSADGFIEAALAAFQAVQALVQDGSHAGTRLQLVIADRPDTQSLQALSGLLKSAVLEHPGLQAQLLWVEPGIAAGDLSALVAAETGSGVVRHRAGVRESLQWAELPVGDAAVPLAFKEDGVYLVTGGLGGLGSLFMREILDRTTKARVVLTGRAEPDAAVAAKLASAVPSEAARRRVAYRRMDVSDAADVQRVLAEVVTTHGRLNGILHTAGGLADQLLVRKHADEFARVLAPKVRGAVHLDAASRELDLDFLVLFSSGASVAGNPGQADYAVANGFLDHFAQLRDRWVAQGLRRGRTLAFNWPLWADGGMRMPEPVRRAMQASSGMVAMSTANGLRAFHHGLAADASQVLVVEGELAKLRETMFAQAAPATPARPVAAGDTDASDLAEPTRDFLRRQFANLLQLPVAKVDTRAPLEQYGIDSILAMDLTAQLEKSFGPLPKTLFFEHQTLDELTAFFVASHGARLAEMFRPAAASAVAAAPAPVAAPAASRTTATARSTRHRPQRVPAAQEPIAIVGLSGRYPQAPDVEAYWRNLRDGKDGITEIPADRWNWRDHYREGRAAEGAHYSKWGGFIDGVDEFDPLFFNIPPVDAEFIDPQERLFLQHAWMAIEDAGVTRAGLQALHVDGHDTLEPGQVGVYVGVMYGEYQLFGAEASLQGQRIGVPVSYASVANRVSYLLNLHGPSMTLDTMCSSSLTAIHLACQDLKQGRTSLAIAGGVNVTIHPNKYLILSAGQFISSDGHCQSFGEGGDGYIPGEGVGAVVLKRLSDAVRDGNTIHGVIKGSALNHGGKTNGYSVPNPKAQASVIEQALKEYGIDARHVSYIEAHGTGTRLGDPIEIAALSQVFRRYTNERGFCAIGSAKSNIGHCESAAGIAGLTKVLLQMKHRQIAPSLHSTVLNPHIDFAATPFVVNQALRDWPAPVVDGRPVPRIAGISSFGAGGSNAHLIVEEYDAPEPVAAAPEPVLAVLSARTAEQLLRRSGDLLDFLHRQQGAVDLASLGHTLQVGREAMDHRFAVVVDSVEQLAEALQAHVAGREVERGFQGQVSRDADGIPGLAQDEDMREALGKWIARRKLARLAELWVKGLAFDWRELHAGRPMRLISLPTYPFAKERHWVGDRVRRTAAAAAAPVLHPLLHANTSDFFQQSYASVFRGDEFFLADHRIALASDATHPVLPGVAYLEMVRAAVDHAWPAEGAPRRLTLRHVVWAQPYVVDGQQAPLSLALSATADGELAFEVSSRAEGANEPVVHCQGRVETGATDEMDLAALQAAWAELAGRASVEAAGVYDRFQAMGLHYGPSFRGLRRWQRGEGQLLAELELADLGEAAFALHPALLDSALQAAIGLADVQTDAPAVPFALDAITLVAPCTPRMRAWVREAAAAEGSEVRKLDIDLCDADGHLCVRLAGLASRPLRAGADITHRAVLMAVPAWEPAPVAVPAFAVAGRRHELLLCGLPRLDAPRLAAALPGSSVRHLEVAEADPAAQYQGVALALLSHVQALVRDSDAPLLQLVLGGAANEAADAALLAGLSGLLDSARLEHPRLVGQLLLVSADADEAGLVRQVLAAAARPAQTLLRCVDAVPQRIQWQVREALDEAPPISAWRAGGVYLVTGGLGGLGRLFTQDILAHAPGAVVVLTGRGPLDAARQAQLEALAAPAGRVVYRALDLGDAAEVQALVDGVVAEFGALNGVLHAAGMTRDRLLAHKSAAEFEAVLAPKVAGTQALDLATRQLPLDFFALFSSVASALGNAGQADYAAANGFMDRHAAQRRSRVAAGQRQGRAVSLHWPLWQDGGMQLDADALRAMTEASGMVPLGAAQGLRAFHRALALDAAQVLVIEGQPQRLRRALQRSHAVAADPVASSAPVATPAGAHALQERAQRYLVAEFAGLMKMPAHEVDAKSPLEHYGMDSVLAMKLTNQLERSFGSLSKTLFFEYQTLASLAAYLVKTFPDAVREKTGGAPVAAAAAANTTVVATTGRALPPAKALPGRLGGTPLPAARVDDIAIIGIGGRYPQADDLAAFWRNLKSGRDCITEIPAQRWDVAPMFHPARHQPGKTYSKWGGFLTDVDRFDALFFGISPKEAELIDPQERLFIETVWETLEDAGYGKEAIGRVRVGVYVGAMWGQYELYGAMPGAQGVPSSSFASIANRVSYFFDLHGPSLAVDTMCSSSLTAIHLACEELRKGGLDLAIAGGVNVSVHPAKYLSLSQGNFASTDGRCRSFGEGGDGYVPGEGVGALLLKPLARALADGDQVHAVIRASSINHGGKTHGYTVPNPVAQGELIAAAFAQARIDPATIGCIETHGTGTALGDPIEITGLVRAFEAAAGAAGTSLAVQSCAIGSLKSNIGHLEAAAGVAAVTKALLQLRHGQLVPSLHAERLNPNIDFERTPFHVQRTLQDWPRPAGHPRRAGVSSFGAGGANAHLVLEAFEDARVPVLRPQRPEAVLLSARSRASLAEVARRLADFLDTEAPALIDLAFTTQVGRTPMAERLVVIADSRAQLQARLREWLQATAAKPAGTRSGAVHDGVYEGSTRDATSNAAALIDGEAGRAFLQLTLAQRDLDKLAQLWIAGVAIDWMPLYAQDRALRVSLPTYPFVRERYWIDVQPAEATAPAEAPQVLHYRGMWSTEPLSGSVETLDGPLLAVGADAAIVAALERALPGTEVVAASFGEAAEAVALLDTLVARGALPRAIVLAPAVADGLAARLDQGVHLLHGLCKAWMARKAAGTLRVLAWCTQDLDDDLIAQPLHASLAGYLKSLALENPKVGWKLLSISGGDAAALLAQELRDAAWRDGELRRAPDGLRERRGFVRVAARELAAARAAGAALKQGGSYLVTGGLGGLGLIFSRHLLQACGARLLLTGRSALDDRARQALASLESLAGAAGRVVYLQADVADAGQARAAVLEARRLFQRLDGVIHSAGVHRDAWVLNKTRDQMEAVFAAKLHGTVHLDQATRDEPLDLFVSFSSVAGALGNPGQADYACANAFLDAHAQARREAVAAGSRSGRTLSINWPLWAEGGMQLSDSNVALMAQRSGLVPLPTAAGVQAFEDWLRLDAEVQGLTLYGLPSRIEAHLDRGTRPVDAKPPAVVSADAAADDSLRAAVEHYLKTLLGTEIKLPVERIDAQERFDAFGVDSMMVSRINASLERDLGPLPKTLFYEYATVEELAGCLLLQAGPALARQLGAVAPVAAPATVRTPMPTMPAPAAPPADEPIAIIGLHGRFPGSETLDDYWQHLREGRDLIGLVPEGRWDREALFDPDPEQARAGKIYCRWGGFLGDVDKFDAAFFSVAPDDARMIDPQERLFIQSVWAAMEDAGYTRDSLRSRHPKGRSADVGVFVGVTTNTYLMLAPDEGGGGDRVAPGSLPWSIANRVSYFFDFQGPSLPIDTACSSSLVAIHAACESLKKRECQVAVAGGVNLYLHPSKYQSLCRRRMLALDGKCRSYGDGDDGFIPSEGVGSVLLKPLSRAIADGDHVYGLVAASACEHSGRSNGYSAPNPNSQAMLIEQALARAGLDATAIGYVEGHGTGTQLGDSLEVAALTQAFRKHTDRQGCCPIGSVKSNLGHAESAAGMAGLAKILLQFRHREIAPTLHAERVNPNIDFGSTPFYLQHRLSAWEAPAGQPRRALINAFGAGGVNSCLVLEEAPAAVAAPASTAPQLVVLSARNELRLRERVEQLLRHLQDGRKDAIDLARLAGTLQAGREAMEERLAFVVGSIPALADRLAGWLRGSAGPGLRAGRVEAHQRRKLRRPEEREPQQALWRRGDLDALGALWIEGHELDWDALQALDGRSPPRRLPLPAYPFAKERYWVSDATAGHLPAEPKTAQLHPLIAHNVSTLREVGFLSMLSGREFYGRDHQVNGMALFPGAGFIELACVSGMVAGEAPVARLEDVTWVRPLQLGSARQQVKTVLRPEGLHTTFAIVSHDGDDEPVLHCEGRLVYRTQREASAHGQGARAAAPRSIAELKAKAVRMLPGAQCYRRLEGFGFHYGPSFQTVQELHGGPGFALASLRLPDALLKDFEHYLLHPSLIDGALQAVSGAVLSEAEGEGGTPFLPFALGAVEIVRPLSPTCFALVEEVGAPGASPEVRRFDISLLSESGELLVALRDFCVRALRAAPAATARPLAVS